MSRTTVRAAVADYLTAGIGTITNLATVYAHPPKTSPAGDFIPEDIPGQASGAAIYLHFAEQSEQRIAIGGPTSGRKLVTYGLGMVIYLYSSKTTTQAIGADNDALLDSLVAYIRASRTAGNSGAIFQWGEGGLPGGTDVRVMASMPIPRRQQGAYVFSTIETTVLEIDTT